MNVAIGSEVHGYWETKKDAREWINSQDSPSSYMIIEEY